MFSFEKDTAAYSQNPKGKPDALTVTQLNNEVLKVIEGHFVHGLWVEAEIRNFKNHSSGHWYFSLVDEESQVSGVMWRGSTKSVGFIPEDGNKLLIYGKPTMYARRGNYQFMALKMLPAGIGARQLALRQLMERLQKEGLFDPMHKKPLPRMPQRIGVVTSRTGAAFRDIMNVLERRAPYVEIILRPATVQGTNAGLDIAKGVEDLNRYGNIDLMIVGRGGGSEDDLWCFNDETLARAIFDSQIPVISAVGHEIDNPVSDFVADVRAPTPSAAAELAVVDSADIIVGLKEQKARLSRALLSQFERKLERLKNARAQRIPKILNRRIADHFQQIDQANLRLQRGIVRNFNLKAMRLRSLDSRLSAASPLSILARGYSIVRSKQNSEIIRNASALQDGDLVNIQFSSGESDARIIGESETKNFKSESMTKKAKKSKKKIIETTKKSEKPDTPSLFD